MRREVEDFGRHRVLNGDMRARGVEHLHEELLRLKPFAISLDVEDALLRVEPTRSGVREIGTRGMCDDQIPPSVVVVEDAVLCLEPEIVVAVEHVGCHDVEDIVLDVPLRMPAGARDDVARVGVSPDVTKGLADRLGFLASNKYSHVPTSFIDNRDQKEPLDKRLSEKIFRGTHA